MTVTAAEPVEPAPLSPGIPRMATAEHAVCPFLRSTDGAWTSTAASRDLRCWAVAPAAQPTPSKQRQLCGVSAHMDCTTHLAALAADAPVAEPDPDGAGLWPSGPPIPVALESAHARPGAGVAVPRSAGQVALVGLMGLALAALVVARANSPADPGGGSFPPASAAASLAVVGSAPPTATSVATAAATPSQAPPSAAAPSAAASSPAPGATASGSAAPTASHRTYKVRSGDTLSAIAAKFHTTVKAIAAANNISDPRTIHAGQVLVIP